MLTRLQLESQARREGVALHAVERDYVQHLFLRQLSPGKLVFKGGTCIRICLGSPRYSEDLDFNATLDRDGTVETLQETCVRLEAYGLKGRIVPLSSIHGFASALQYEGPLFTGNDRSRGAIHVNVSLRKEIVDTETAFVPMTPYPDVPQLVLPVLRKDHLLAEKTRALLARKKPRDLYDVHFLLAKGILMTTELLDRKLAIYSMHFSMDLLEQSLAEVRLRWERDLHPILGQLPPFEAISAEVLIGLRKVLS